MAPDFDLIITARNKAKLEQIAQELQSDHPVQMNMAGPIDPPHASLAQQVQQAITGHDGASVRNPLLCRRGGASGCFADTSDLVRFQSGRKPSADRRSAT